MKPDQSGDIYFILYALAVLFMAVLYFAVPERAVFLENQLTWWSEFVMLFQ